MKRSHTFNVTVEYGGHSIRVEGEATPYVPAVPYLRNGDPGYPAEGGELEDVRLFLVRGARERELPDKNGKLLEKIEEEIYRKIEERSDNQ